MGAVAASMALPMRMTPPTVRATVPSTARTSFPEFLVGEGFAAGAGRGGGAEADFGCRSSVFGRMLAKKLMALALASGVSAEGQVRSMVSSMAGAIPGSGDLSGGASS